MTKLPLADKLHEGFEVSKNVADALFDSSQDLQDPQAILEGYARGAFEMHIHFGFVVVGAFAIPCHEFCARFQRYWFLRRRQHRTFATEMPQGTAYRVLFMSRKDHDDLPVLVLAREIVEDGKRMEFARFARVRLTCLSECLVMRKEARQPPFERTGSVGLLPDDWPRNEFGFMRVRLRASLKQLPREVVERRTEVEQCISDDQVPLVGQRGDLSNVNDQAPVGSVFAEFDAERGPVSLRFNPSTYFDSHSLRVIYCPVKLRPSIRKNAHGR